LEIPLVFTTKNENKPIKEKAGIHNHCCSLIKETRSYALLIIH